MKRLIASILSLALLFALCACAPAQQEDNEVVDGAETEESEQLQPDGEGAVENDENAPAAEGEEEKKEEDNKGGLTVSGTPSKNDNNTSSSTGGGLKVETEDVPVIEGEKVEIVPVTPAPDTTQKPQENQQASATVAQTLLKDFKSRVNSNPGASAETIANGLLSNSVIKFDGGVVPVEPGLLTGFDNAEIKGFSEGAMFAPMIGTIPFVGYVFTLDAGTNAADFVATLKKNANPRWNICTEAEETVADSAGNKVFFVMSLREMTE